MHKYSVPISEQVPPCLQGFGLHAVTTAGKSIILSANVCVVCVVCADMYMLTSSIFHNVNKISQHNHYNDQSCLYIFCLSVNILDLIRIK